MCEHIDDIIYFTLFWSSKFDHNISFLSLCSAAPHPNINLQMNYWPSLPCNLSECQEPLIEFIASLAVNGAKTAKVSSLAFLFDFVIQCGYYLLHIWQIWE
jgi:hypothetical protein